jgi:hypothetical protein
MNADEVRIPIELDGGTPVIPFTSPDGRRWRLELDTGAGWTVTTPAFAAAMGAATQPASVPYQDAAGAGTAGAVATFRTFALNAVTFNDFDAGVVDMRCPYDALLGWPMWRELLVTIDYPHRMLVLKRGSLPLPDGKQILPLRVSKAGQLEVPVTLDGSDRWLVLDTGSGEPDCIELTPASAAKAVWAAPPAGKYPRNAVGHVFVQKLGLLKRDMALGRYRFTKMVGATNDGLSVDVLGAQVLENFTLTLDLKNLRARFERRDNVTIRFANTFDCGFRYNSGGTVRMVLSVLPGSEAARAGLRRGDILLTINGRPANENMAGSDSSKPMVIDIWRGFKTLTLRFPWTKVDP